jgi:hypothetical protein
VKKPWKTARNKKNKRPDTNLRYITIERNALRSFSLIFGYGCGEIRVFKLHPIHHIKKPVCMWPHGFSQYLVILRPRHPPQELFIFSSFAQPFSSERMNEGLARSVGARNGALAFSLEQLYSERKSSVDALSTLSFSSCLG